VRTADQTPPPVTGHRPPRPPGWGADLWVAIERLPVTAYHWSDYTSVWDAPGSKYRWDDWTAANAFTDATCDVSGLDIELGAPDDEGRVDAGHLVFTLANDDGRWSQYDPFGRLVAYEPGSRVYVWATIAGVAWWLFAGVVAAWREGTDATVEVEAFDASSDLNVSVGEWLPGTVGQRAHDRIAAILSLIGYPGPRRLDVGTVTLLAYTTTATPLEEMQAVATSDGGYVAVDADGTFLYRSRSWTAGRTDQTRIVVFSDTVCNVDAVVWDLELVTDDQLLLTDVQLTNLDKVVAQRQVTATRRYPFARAGDQWITAAEGSGLVDYLLARRTDSYLRVDGFTLHLTAPSQDLWRIGIDLRVGDLVRLLHDQPAVGGVDRIDLNLVVQAVTHRITPDAWTVEVATTRATGNNVIYRWGGPGMLWDRDPARWGN